MKPGDLDIVVQEVVRKTLWVFSECVWTPPRVSGAWSLKQC